MRKIKYVVTVALLAACLALTAAAAGCGGNATLEIDTSGAIVIFEVGEEFSADGIVVYEKHGDGKNVRVPTSEYTVTAPDTSEVGEKTVTVTYGEQTATYTVSVVVPEVTSTFVGTIEGGLGGGYTVSHNVEFRCYNTLKWELWYADGVRDSGRYSVENGVYSMALSTATAVTQEDAQGNVTFMYVGIGLPAMPGMGTRTANFNGTLTLQK